MIALCKKNTFEDKCFCKSINEGNKMYNPTF